MIRGSSAAEQKAELARIIEEAGMDSIRLPELHLGSLAGVELDRPKAVQHVMRQATPSGDNGIPKDEQYIVRGGDTLAKIAKHFYGDESLAPILASANGITDVDLIPRGTPLSIPASLSPDAVRSNTRAVRDLPDCAWIFVDRKHETPESVAKEQYGDSRFAGVVREANHLSPNAQSFSDANVRLPKFARHLVALS